MVGRAAPVFRLLSAGLLVHIRCFILDGAGLPSHPRPEPLPAPHRPMPFPNLAPPQRSVELTLRAWRGARALFGTKVWMTFPELSGWQHLCKKLSALWQLWQDEEPNGGFSGGLEGGLCSLLRFCLGGASRPGMKYAVGETPTPTPHHLTPPSRPPLLSADAGLTRPRQSAA